MEKRELEKRELEKREFAEARKAADAEGEDIFSPEELQAVRAFYFERLTDGERRILRAFEGPLKEGAPEEARMAAFAELRRSGRLRDYIEASEACRLADKATALGIAVSRAASVKRASRPQSGV